MLVAVIVYAHFVLWPHFVMQYSDYGARNTNVFLDKMNKLGVEWWYTHRSLAAKQRGKPMNVFEIGIWMRDVHKIVEFDKCVRVTDTHLRWDHVDIYVFEVFDESEEYVYLNNERYFPCDDFIPIRADHMPKSPDILVLLKYPDESSYDVNTLERIKAMTRLVHEEKSLHVLKKEK